MQPRLLPAIGPEPLQSGVVPAPGLLLPANSVWNAFAAKVPGLRNAVQLAKGRSVLSAQQIQDLALGKHIVFALDAVAVGILSAVKSPSGPVNSSKT